MVSAFQQNAFQDDAFQIDGGQVVVQPDPSPRGSGRLAKAWWKRRSGIYWPKKISKKKVEEIIEEAIEDIAPEHAKAIDVGVLAGRIMESNTPAMLRALEIQQDFIAMIIRELEEQDDEEVIMWLLSED